MSMFQKFSKNVLSKFQSVTEQAKTSIKEALHFKFDVIVKTSVKWFTLLMNEPSLGLYHIQTHFKNLLTSQSEQIEETKQQNKKLQITQDQVKFTQKEIKEIGDLNQDWCRNMANLIDKMNLKQQKKSEQLYNKQKQI